MTDFLQGHILLVNKPLQWTSFDVVNKLRGTLQHLKNEEDQKPFRKIKVGHAGTLDPLATGLLIVCTGAATKNIDRLMGMEKEYTGTIFLGATTPSYDKETPVEQTYDTAHLTTEIIVLTASKFTGVIQQTPPAHSATIVNGERAYEKARRGETVLLPSKEILISSFDILKIELPLVYFRVVCSKGTYIRSLAHDFGSALQSGAYLDSLCRTRIGDFQLQDALTVEDWVQRIKNNFRNSNLLSET
jgi:tRNA pseudouridine55 synthase